MTHPGIPTIEDMSHERLEARIQELARRLSTDQKVDDLETWYLARVVEHCSRAIANVYGGADLEQILRGDVLKPEGLDDLFRTGPAPIGGTIRRVTCVPEGLRGIGDRCLYDIGMAGVRDYHGVSLEKLGIQSYRMAARILTILANERDLRELFQHNRVRALTIDEEVAFLRQCASRFTFYAHLLTNLRDDPLSVPVPGLPSQGPEVAVNSRTGAADSGVPAVQSPTQATSAAPRGPGAAERTITRYERLLLFAKIDFTRLREDLGRAVIGQGEAVDKLCGDFLFHTTGTVPRLGAFGYLLRGPRGVGRRHLMVSLAAALEAQWGLEVPVLIMEVRGLPRSPAEEGLAGGLPGFPGGEWLELVDEIRELSSRWPLSILVLEEIEWIPLRIQRHLASVIDPPGPPQSQQGGQDLEGCIVAFTSAPDASGADATAQGHHGDDSHPQDLEEARGARPARLGRVWAHLQDRLRVLDFSPLSRPSREAILTRALDRVLEHFLSRHGLEVVLTPSARMRLHMLGFSELEGARPLAEAIHRYCEAGVSRAINRDEVNGDGKTDEMLRMIREDRSGNPEAGEEVTEADILQCLKFRLPYRRIVIDEASGEFSYRGEG